MKVKADSEAEAKETPRLDGDHDAHRPEWVARGQSAVDASVESDDNDRETNLVDALCVLRHWAEDAGVDYESADRSAAWHYAHEKLRSRGAQPSTPEPRAPQFGPDQQRRAMDLVEDLAWGDMESYIKCLEEALRLALEATVDDLQRWEHECEEIFGDEFSLSPEQVEDLNAEWRLAYVACLIHTLGLCYGLSKDSTGHLEPLGGDRHTPAGLLRGLNDIVDMRLVPGPVGRTKELRGGQVRDRRRGDS